ncbi:polysaccharide deacetylase family protein [Alkaliphilus transvaalensis]|uniref:polysaccharide deacetylase family protein n=1 Tax=Alkaliphilus transvaalensis TaxID=114628 RepID=UPI0006873385|nr:polysaccharide deacetylase family protein [Alkaliphilus transvaalensis]
MKKIMKVFFGLLMVLLLLVSVFSFRGIAQGFLEDRGVLPIVVEPVGEVPRDNSNGNNIEDNENNKGDGGNSEIEGAGGNNTSEGLTDSNNQEEEDTINKDNGKKKPDVEVGNKKVYLTFDDGPTTLTPKVLEVLKEHHVKATFFMIGQLMERSASKVLEVYDEGHSILPHSYSHNYSIYTTFATFYEDFYKAEETFKDILGYDPPPFFRFPGGSSNHSSFQFGGRQFMPRLTLDVISKGYYYVDWNVDSGDTSKDANNPQKLLDNVINGSKGKDVVVVLFHDTARNTAMLEILPEVINYYIENGYEFLTFEDMTNEDIEELINLRLINRQIIRD